MTFETLGLRPELLRAVSEQGYTEPTAVQAGSVRPILEGRDVMASARTGTGKTAAFVLPLLHRLTDGPSSARPRVLVLTPTRELAAQVHDSLRAYGRHLSLRTAVIFGGVNINPQIAKLRRGVDVVIATPGRLIDHLQRGTVDLGGIETLVLDEADRMLDMGFKPAIDRIVARVPSARQTLLFSATFSREITAMARGFLNDPVRVETAPANTTVEAISQRAIHVDQSRKRELLSWMIADGQWKQVLVFVRTKHGANRLARQLEADGLRSAAIHGNKTQAARIRALDDFKKGRIRVLVATDIAARGLDIDQLPHVVNFDLPHVAEDYVHRIGRTGRAGRDGSAVSLVSAAERGAFEGVRRLIKVPLELEVIEGYQPTRQAPPRRPAQAQRRKPAGGKPHRGRDNRQARRPRNAA